MEDVPIGHPLWIGVRHLIRDCAIGYLFHPSYERDEHMGYSNFSNSIHW